MDYEVLSPLAEVDPGTPRGLVPRVTDLKGKTIGVFAFFKWYGPPQMRGVEEALKERFPDSKFSHFSHLPGLTKFAHLAYPDLNTEIMTNKKYPYKQQFLDWVKSVDTIVSGNGD